MDNWKSVVVAPETSLRDAIAVIDRSAHQVALVATAEGALVGVLTDGDIRRAVLAAKSLELPVSEVMGRQPTTAKTSTSREDILALMRRKVIHHLPLIDDSGRLAGLATLSDLAGIAEQSNWVVLMVGGLGTRLSPLTNETPKALLEVGGKRILETIIESFAEQGFHTIYLAVNHKADMIRDYFGGGEKLGVRIEYLHERIRLGTAGALSLLPTPPTAPVIVMNGDLLTRVNFASLLAFHNSQGVEATMAVREYDVRVPYGVVRLQGARIASIEEKPVQRHFVNAGIYVLSPATIARVPKDTYEDMPTLFERVMEAGRPTAAYPLREFWIDVGRMEELERAHVEWTRAES